MATLWQPHPTNTHQDHVIAHVVGATVLGYFRADEALHFVLDIGFVWTVYLDGEMSLVPQSVGVSQLSIAQDEKEALARDVSSLDGGGAVAAGGAVTPAPPGCLIEEVEFYAGGEGHRILIRGEEAGLAVETSFVTREMLVEETGALQ